MSLECCCSRRKQCPAKGQGFLSSATSHLGSLKVSWAKILFCVVLLLFFPSFSYCFEAQGPPALTLLQVWSVAAAENFGHCMAWAWRRLWWAWCAGGEPGYYVWVMPGLLQLEWLQGLGTNWICSQNMLEACVLASSPAVGRPHPMAWLPSLPWPGLWSLSPEALLEGGCWWHNSSQF